MPLASFHKSIGGELIGMNACMCKFLAHKVQKKHLQRKLVYHAFDPGA